MKQEVEITCKNHFSDREVLVIGVPLVTILWIGIILMHLGVI